MAAGRRLQEGLAEEEGRHGGDEDRQPDHRRGVVAGEAVHPPLGGGLLGLGLLDQVDDPADGAILRQAGDLDLQRALAVDGAGEDLVAGPLLHRHALAGDRGLVDRRGALEDAPVHRDPLPGADEDAVAHGQFGHVHPLLVGLAPGAGAALVGRAVRQRPSQVLLAVGAGPEDGGLGRGQFHQGTDRVPRPVHRVTLQRLPQAEEEDHQRALLPRADGHRAQGGHRHQEVDVQFPVDPDARKPLAGHVVTADADGEAVEGVGDPQGDPARLQAEGQEEQEAGEEGEHIPPPPPHKGEQAAQPAGARLGGLDHLLLLGHVVPQFADAAHDVGLVHLFYVVLHPHPAGGEVDGGVEHPVQPPDPLLQFDRAVGAVQALQFQISVAVPLLDGDPLLAGVPLHLRQGDQVGIVVQAETGRIDALVDVSLQDALMQPQGLLEPLHAVDAVAVLRQKQRDLQFQFLDHRSS